MAGIATLVCALGVMIDGSFTDWWTINKLKWALSSLVQWIIANAYLLRGFGSVPVSPRSWNLAILVIVLAPVAIVSITKALQSNVLQERLTLLFAEKPAWGSFIRRVLAPLVVDDNLVFLTTATAPLLFQTGESCLRAGSQAVDPPTLCHPSSCVLCAAAVIPGPDAHPSWSVWELYAHTAGAEQGRAEGTAGVRSHP